MARAITDDGVQLYFTEAGTGTPIMFVHEFAGDHRSWELQIAHFVRRYHCIAFNARGYAPSDVPATTASYSQTRAADDILAVLDHLAIEKAHVVGLSMGGFAALHFGFRHAERARSLCIASCGYGAQPSEREGFGKEIEANASFIKAHGMAAFAENYASGATRVQLEQKNRRAFAEFKRVLAEHSAIGSRNTLLGVQRDRPSLYDLTDHMKALSVPTLILAGDEDWPCLLPGALMKRHIPSAGFSLMPNCGHAVNIEEPDEFNRILGVFLTQVAMGRWPMRDPRAMRASIAATD